MRRNFVIKLTFAFCGSHGASGLRACMHANVIENIDNEDVMLEDNIEPSDNCGTYCTDWHDVTIADSLEPTNATIPLALVGADASTNIDLWSLTAHDASPNLTISSDPAPPSFITEDTGCPQHPEQIIIAFTDDKGKHCIPADMLLSTTMADAYDELGVNRSTFIIQTSDGKAKYDDTMYSIGVRRDSTLYIVRRNMLCGGTPVSDASESMICDEPSVDRTTGGWIFGAFAAVLNGTAQTSTQVEIRELIPLGMVPEQLHDRIIKQLAERRRPEPMIVKAEIARVSSRFATAFFVCTHRCGRSAQFSQRPRGAMCAASSAAPASI